MGRNNIIVEFLENEYWNSSKGQKNINEIRIVPMAHRKVVYGLNIFFRAGDFLRTLDTFESIQEMTRVITKCSAKVDSLWTDYNYGHIKIVSNIAHENYSDEAIIVLIKRIIKDLSKTKISPPART